MNAIEHVKKNLSIDKQDNDSFLRSWCYMSNGVKRYFMVKKIGNKPSIKYFIARAKELIGDYERGLKEQVK